MQQAPSFPTRRVDNRKHEKVAENLYDRGGGKYLFVKTDPRYLRPAEVDALCGDASKARQELRWDPTVTFSELVRMMVDSDMELASSEAALKRHKAANGHR